MPRGGSRPGAGRKKGSKNKPKLPTRSPEENNSNNPAAAVEDEFLTRATIEEEGAGIPDREERDSAEQSDGLNTRLQEDLEATVGNRNAASAENSGGGDDHEEEYCKDDEDKDHDGKAGGVGPQGEPGTSEGNSKAKLRNRNEYRPPPGSPLDKHLKEKKKEIIKEANLQTGRCWYPPEHGALEEKSVNPNHFYTEAPMIYCFSPLQSRRLPGGKKSIKDFYCIHCSRAGDLQSNGWYYRYQHNFADSVWLLHQRLACCKREGKKGCGQTFATFHPQFMAQLPTVISERFPFLITPSGVGIHIAMMDQFLSFSAKGMLFSAYCNSINEMKKTKYYRDHCGYLDLLADRKEKPTQPFSPYTSAGQYNGVPLKQDVLKRLFLQVMSALEPFVQESSQLEDPEDDKEVIDHLLESSKQVMASNRTGCVPQDSISLASRRTLKRFCHTKSNNDLKALIRLYRKVRINVRDNGFLVKLGEPAAATEDGFDAFLDAISAIQKEASDNNNRAQQLLAEGNTGGSNVVGVAGEEIARVIPPVAPVVAPAQTPCIATAPPRAPPHGKQTQCIATPPPLAPHFKGRSIDYRRCSGACFGCPELGIDCAWKGWRNCKRVIAGTLEEMPATEEAREAKYQKWVRGEKAAGERKRKAARKAERRAKRAAVAAARAATNP